MGARTASGRPGGGAASNSRRGVALTDEVVPPPEVAGITIDPAHAGGGRGAGATHRPSARPRAADGAGPGRTRAARGAVEGPGGQRSDGAGLPCERGRGAPPLPGRQAQAPASHD
eukprot:6203440-Pleurochrysis_carterae.AAC.2